jgi:hypothetical protein
MSVGGPPLNSSPLSNETDARLSQLLEGIQQLADELGDQPEAQLTLLRRLEQLHRTIQDGPFRSGLPSDRNALFNLLRQMESSGGWPYIPRLQLRTFMDLLQRGEPTPDDDNHPLAV